MAEKRIIELEIQTNEKSLKAQLREAQAEVAALSEKFGATSQAAIQAAKRAAELKDTIGDAKNLTDAFNPDAKFNALSNSIGGVLNGFQAFEGALGLVGVEGEAVQETMLKVQSAMAFSQGIQGVFEAKDSFKQLGAVIKDAAIKLGILTVSKEADVVATTENIVATEAQAVANVGLATSTATATTGMKLFRLALISTGIGAIVVAIGLLIANFDKVSAAVMKAYEWFDKLGPKIKVLSIGLLALVSGPLALFAGAIYGVVKALEYFGVIDDRETARMKANAKAKTDATEKELNKKIAAEKRKAQAVDENLSFEIRKAQAAGKNTEEMEEKKLQAALKSGRAILKMQKEKIAAYEAEIKMLRATGDADSERAKKLEKSLSETKKAANEQYKENKKNSDDLTILQITAEKERTDKAVAAAKERKDKIKQIRDSELEQIRENNRLALAENQARLRTEQEQAEFEVNEKYNAQIALAKKYGKDTTQLETAQANEINEIRLKYQQEDYAKKEELRQKELDAIKEANRLNIEAEQQLQAQIEEIDEANFQARLQKSMTEEQYELELVRQKYFALEEAAKGNAEQLAIIEEAKQAEIDKIEKTYAEKAKASQQARVDLILKYAQTFGQAMSSLNNLLNANDEARLKNVKNGSKEEEAIKRKMFDRDKKLRIVQTIIDTASNVVQSVRNGGGIPTGIPFGIAAGAMGALQIAAISKTKFDGGGGEQPPSPNAGGGMVQSPNFSVIGSSGVNQLAQLQQQPVQAYVVSGEVTSQQALDRNRVQNATL